MKKIIIFSILGLAGIFSACTDIFSESYIELAPTEDLNEERIFSEYTLFRQYADQTYSYMPGHYARLWNSLVSSMGDETRPNSNSVATSIFNNGSWNGSVTNDARAELNEMWTNMYKGIRKANMIIENIHRVNDFPSDKIKDRYIGEAYFLRAFFYFELTRRWGSVPIIDKVLNPNKDELDVAPSPYDDCVEFIVADCDKAASMLPSKYDDIDNGRATEGAALALKSRVLLYAARPLHNPTGDVNKWKAAAKAAKDVIDLNRYSLYPDYVNLFFQPICDEIIMNKPQPKQNFEQGHPGTGGSFWVRFIATQGYSGWAQQSVSLNLVNKFEDSKGYPINHTSSNYNSQDPYSNRDPRLAMCVLYNDRFWYDRNLEFWSSEPNENGEIIIGRDKGENYRCVLAHAIGKFWPESHQRYKGTSTYFNYTFFRYAEILLNFAEAQNEVGGPESNLDGLTVRSVLSELRKRVNHVPVVKEISDTKEKMRDRIRNERAVELCFEEHRWYDVLSWHEGVNEFTKPIYGMDIVKKNDGTFVYTPFQYGDTPIFKEHMHLYPFPDDEVYKSNYLKQNPGWN